jgi:VWFA-related protein
MQGGIGAGNRNLTSRGGDRPDLRRMRQQSAGDLAIATRAGCCEAIACCRFVQIAGRSACGPGQQTGIPTVRSVCSRRFRATDLRTESKDFIVYENSRSFPVAYFREHKNDEPAAIALVVDTSGSMVPKLPIVKQSLSSFVTNLNRCDEVILFAFSGHPYLLTPFSTDHKMTAEKIELLHAYGQTAIFDAVRTALQSLAVADYTNRAIVLITDGIDNASIAEEKDVLEQGRKDRVPIYAVGIGDPNAKGQREVAIGPYVIGMDDSNRVDAKSLKDLAESAGGRSFIVPATGEDGGKGFKNAISAIANSIAQGYTIGAVIPADVTLSNVNETIANRPDAVVRAHLIAASP